MSELAVALFTSMIVSNGQRCHVADHIFFNVLYIQSFNITLFASCLEEHLLSE